MTNYDDKPSVLVVDDDETIREMISKILSLNGFQVVLASDGLEALNLLEQNRIQIVITDMKMPEMDGME
ncbi:MAG: response regulator, partial [candidate division Zixibacteria bacterium]|nr:response regulator [candidate division Zixibacteria bacterium]